MSSGRASRYTAGSRVAAAADDPERDPAPGAGGLEREIRPAAVAVELGGAGRASRTRRRGRPVWAWRGGLHSKFHRSNREHSGLRTPLAHRAGSPERKFQLGISGLETLARPEGLEPSTCGLEVRRSIQLS